MRGAGCGGGHGDPEAAGAELAEFGRRPRGPSGGRGGPLPPAEAEDALGGRARGRSGVYYSPPGTSYTIVERPGSAAQHHRERDRERDYGHYNSVLRLFGAHSSTGGRPARRSPVGSPPAGPARRPTSAYRHSPTAHEMTTRTVAMVREQQEGSHGFGICVKGGKDAGVGVYISRIEEGSVAERAGLRPGDSILEVNGTPFTAISHEEALKMLKSCRKLSMTVRSPTMPPGGGIAGPGGAPWQMRQTCSWMDRLGRPVSPPLEYAARGAAPQRYGGGYGRPASRDRTVRRQLREDINKKYDLLKVEIANCNSTLATHASLIAENSNSIAQIQDNQSTLRSEFVDLESKLNHTKDTVVSLASASTSSSLSGQELSERISRSKNIIVHRLPENDSSGDKTAVAEMLKSRAAQTTRKWAAALQMVEEKARVLLSRPEFTTMCYYTDEYAARHMTIDAFVQVMTELFNTPDKRKGMPIPDANHSIFSGYHEEYTSGDEEDPAGNRSRRHSSPGGSRSGSTTALHQQEYTDAANADQHESIMVFISCLVSHTDLINIDR
ncbi:unnamed protein product [Phaedon cochleariae]|uniref:PDZ domain-containing protein n=1 Tax=Phaedon cochleariae TaxID=80249 RepID=A0A9N9SBW3_PHACE|nr:unnamed protein product [Phaedon cochleariae]